MLPYSRTEHYIVKKGETMSEDVFLKPRLIGKRFDEHSIPLEFLQDLAVLEQMIKETAKWQFFLTHPERKRIPRGFF